MKISMIEAYDHFSTDNNEENCIARFIGEIIGEDDRYIRLRHIKADIENIESAEEVHCILKVAIKERNDFEVPTST